MKEQKEPMALSNAVVYTDPEGNERQGWYKDGHVYEDEAATVPIAVGSRVTAADGRIYEMTEHGGELRYAPYEVDANGNWVKEGNAWYRRLRELWDGLESRGPFAFDLNADALYRAYESRYQAQGRRAMEDAVGRLSGLTGGYGSSYAEGAGQLAYGTYLEKLAAAVPDLYVSARKVYDRETDAILSQIGAAGKRYEADYSRYEKEHRQAQSYAYRTAIRLLQKGQMPSDETLQAAGIARSDAEIMARVYGK